MCFNFQLNPKAEDSDSKICFCSSSKLQERADTNDEWEPLIAAHETVQDIIEQAIVKRSQLHGRRSVSVNFSEGTQASPSSPENASWPLLPPLDTPPVASCDAMTACPGSEQFKEIDSREQTGFGLGSEAQPGQHRSLEPGLLPESVPGSRSGELSGSEAGDTDIGVRSFEKTHLVRATVPNITPALPEIHSHSSTANASHIRSPCKPDNDSNSSTSWTLVPELDNSGTSLKRKAEVVWPRLSKKARPTELALRSPHNDAVAKIGYPEFKQCALTKFKPFSRRLLDTFGSWRHLVAADEGDTGVSDGLGQPEVPRGFDPVSSICIGPPSQSESLSGSGESSKRPELDGWVKTSKEKVEDVNNWLERMHLTA